MERIIEPELMVEEEQCYAYAQADFNASNAYFVNLIQEHFGENFQGHVLDIGCGNAEITLGVAQAYGDCSIDGIDGSPSMLHYGRKALDAHAQEVKNRVQLIEGIVPNLQLPQSHYDGIISNSLLHHLHEPSVLWQFIKIYGVEGTRVCIGDLFRPGSPEKALEIVELYAKEEPEILKGDFYNSLLAAFEIREIQEQLKIANLEYLSVQKISDRHVLISGILENLPGNLD